jgi:nucleoside-diphosphate-sugar epimerase
MLEIFFAEKYYGEVNISGEQEVKIKDVVKILSNYTGKKNIKYDLSKPEGPTRRAVNLDKFNKHYKTRPTIDLETGVKNLFDYVKSNCNTTSVLS